MTSNFIDVNNTRLHYMEEGSGELVILLHGFPEFWYAWRQQIPVLSKGYRIVAPDMRGYNLSDKPAEIKDYSIDLLAKDIADLIDKLGDGQAIVVGHDWGGAVAWALASLYPQKVKKLAVLNIPHPAEMRKALYGFNLKQMLKSYYIFLFQLPALPERMVGKDLPGFFKRVFGSGNIRLSKEELDAYVEAYQKPGVITATLNYYRATFRYPKSLKGEGKLKMPVLMLWGEKDVNLGKELSFNTANYCENLELVYDPKSGHFIQHNNPAFVNDKLLEFFARAN